MDVTISSSEMIYPPWLAIGRCTVVWRSQPSQEEEVRIPFGLGSCEGWLHQTSCIAENLDGVYGY